MMSVDFRGAIAGTAELTWGQLRVWRTARETGRTMNLVSVFPLPEGTALADIVAILRSAVSNHPALRTRLRMVDGQPWQVVAESGQVPLEVVDVGPSDDWAAVAEDVRARYELTWFDYEHEFPIRLGVVRQGGTLRAMIVGFSHVMVDGAGLAALLREMEQPTRPGADLDPLALAKAQYGPAGRRQTARSMRYWATQLARLTDWRNVATQPGEPRFRELVAYSPAMELGLRAVEARTETPSTYVLLAAYAVAVARVLGRNPAVAQIVASNRFRPGFADAVLQVSQPAICVVDADGPFDEVIGRAMTAATTGSFYGYYDPVARDTLLAELEPPDIGWHLNDRRAILGAAGGGPPTPTALRDALPRTRLYWGRAQPTFDGSLFVQVDSRPIMTSREALDDGRPAVYLEVWADTHTFAPGQVEALVREMEAVIVAAAFRPATDVG